MWIVMTSSAKMPNNCWGKYRNVALVQLDQHYTARNWTPKMISTHARGVLSVRHMGHHFDGQTDRCAYVRAYHLAQQRADALNNSTPDAHGEMLMSWGGSA